MNAQQLGQRLSQWMAQSAHLKTSEALAKKSRTSFGTVQRMRRGEANPSLENLVAIAGAFGRHVSELVAPEDRAALLPPPEAPLEPPLDAIVSNARAMSSAGQYDLLGYSQGLVRLYPKPTAPKAKAA